MPSVFLYSKVRTVQQVIRLTRENLEELDRHFKGVRHPPSMFLEVRLLGFLPLSVDVLKTCRSDIREKPLQLRISNATFFDGLPFTLICYTGQVNI
jgi:hypothetical protein